MSLKYPEKYLERKKFYPENLEDTIITIKRLCAESKWTQIRLDFRRYIIDGHKFKIYAYVHAKKPKQKLLPQNTQILKDIVDNQAILVKQIKDVKERLKNMGVF